MIHEFCHVTSLGGENPFALKHRVKWSAVVLAAGAQTQTYNLSHAEPHSFLLTNGRGACIYIVKLEDSERGKGSEGGLSEPWPCSLFLFPTFLCATHCSGFFNLALISCTPDETNTDSFFTFVKAPTAAVPISPHVYESGPDPSWPCREREREG